VKSITSEQENGMTRGANACWWTIGAIALMLAGTPAHAQVRAYQPGEMVRMEGAEAYRIVRCLGPTEWDECEVEAFENGRLSHVGILRMTIRNLRAGEERRRAAAVARGEAPAAPASPARPARPAPPAMPSPPPVAVAQGENTCRWDPPGAAVTARTPFSAALARRKIYDQYRWKANGTGSAPLRVGVTFLALTPTGSYRNTVQNVPGYGAQRRHAGAPVNATVYTLRSRHIVCEEYRTGISRRQVEGTHACFISRDEEWTCPSENDTRITPLDR
jgi:hypothetical protein